MTAVRTKKSHVLRVVQQTVTNRPYDSSDIGFSLEAWSQSSHPTVLHLSGMQTTTARNLEFCHDKN